MMMDSSVRRMVSLAARSDSTVLLGGATGVGKTSLAERIHLESCRRLGPFVRINLATCHEGTLESELFGHEKGAFTGADRKRVGRLEQAHQGTVLLDEIAELPMRLQARLLEFLQSKKIVPVGGNREIELDVRIIAATHRPLSLAVEQGTFRADLFHRLRVLAIDLPSITEIAEDVFGAIIHKVLEDVCREQGRLGKGLSPQLQELFERHSWPGNFRELKNVLEYAVLHSEEPEIQVGDLPGWFNNSIKYQKLTEKSIQLRARSIGHMVVELSTDYRTTVAQFEREYLKRVLEINQGRIARSARGLGISKTTLLRRLKAYGFSSI